jgi:hypothetical protein
LSRATCLQGVKLFGELGEQRLKHRPHLKREAQLRCTERAWTRDRKFVPVRPTAIATVATADLLLLLLRRRREAAGPSPLSQRPALRTLKVVQYRGW